MSDEEDIHSEEEVSEEEEEEETKVDTGPSEAELAMQRRRAKEQLASSGLDEAAQELLAANEVEREQLAKEISEMRQRSERRKKEREEEERRLAKQRAEEDSRRKADEEERKRKKEEEESKRRQERAQKMAEFEKWKNPPKPNFVIQKREGGAEDDADEEGAEAGGEKKSREQLEAEKKAILAQRIQPLNIDGADMSKLTEKAKELQALILRLESEKYDLEKRFKGQQLDMMELAERARQMNKVGRGGQIKRLQVDDDLMQQKFAGCPSKIVMYSEYERQKDKRGYGDRREIYKGPVYGFPAERIKPHRVVRWDEATGLPIYEEIPGAEAPAAAAGGEEEEE